jgi:hypothetical protein
VIDTASNTVTATIAVGANPIAFGMFIVAAKPTPTCAGTPGFSNCHGQCVAALAHQYGGMSAAAAALGFPSVSALQTAITAFCHP